jgi:hypothetical protein
LTLNIKRRYLVEFVTTYDAKTYIKHNENRIIHWVSFIICKDSENHYRELLLLFKHFLGIEANWKYWKMLTQMKKKTLKNYYIYIYIYITSIFQMNMPMNGTNYNHEYNNIARYMK